MNDEGCDNIPMMERGSVLVEDEFGYVESVTSSDISKDILKQLPSNQIEELSSQNDPNDGTTTYHRKSLKRSETEYMTMKLQRMAYNMESSDVNAEKVYQVLSSDINADVDNITNTIKDLYQGMTLKRMVKSKLDADKKNRQKAHSLDFWNRSKNNLAMSWMKFKNCFKDFRDSLELWHGSLKKIQGHSGSSVAFYFKFLRWLLYLNLFNLMVTGGFVILPQVIHQNNENSPSNITFSGYDLLTGSGWIGNSSFFYGQYLNTTMEIGAGYRYNMPLAYLVVISVTALVNLIVVSYSAAKAYLVKYISSSSEINKAYNKMFCTWDFTIEKPNTAELQHNLIYREMLEWLLREKSKTKIKTSFCSCISKVGISLIINAFVLSSIGGSGYLMHFLLENKIIEMYSFATKHLALAMLVTCIFFLFHYAMVYVTKLEYFLSKQAKLHLLIARVAALRIMILIILVYFWKVTYIPNKTQCYESLMGQEVYRLIIMNFIMNLFCTIFFEFLRTLVVKYVRTKRLALPEFDVAYNTCDLIYFQTLVWLGLFYTPILPLLFFLVLVLLFYVKFYSALYVCQIPQESWSSTDAQGMFLGITLINFLISNVAVGYTLFSVGPSSTCGPFQTQIIFDVFAKALNFPSIEQSSSLRQIYLFVTSSVMLPTAALALTVTVLFVRQYALAHEKNEHFLRQLLILESKDKAFLLQMFIAAHRNYVLDAGVSQNGGNDHEGDSAGTSQQSSFENLNQAYQDSARTRGSKLSPIVEGPSTRYDPGYLKANVPINSSSISDSDSGQSSESVQLDKHKLKKKRGDRSAISMPSTSQNILPRPVHKPGFQYLLRSEPPPRFDSSTKMD